MSDNETSKYALTESELDAVADIVFNTPNNMTLQMAFAKIQGLFIYQQAELRNKQKGNGIANVSDSTSVGNLTLKLIRNDLGELLANFYKDDKRVVFKMLTDNELSNLQDLEIKEGESIPLEYVIEHRNNGYVNGWWLGTDDGDTTNFDKILDDLIEGKNY